MLAAVALVFSKRPGVAVPAGAMPDPTALEVGFEARHRLDWSGDAGRIRLSYWHDQPARVEGAWHEQDGGASFVVGDTWWHGEAWAPAAHWAPRLTTVAPDAPLDDLQGHLRGLFVAGRVTARGEGWLVTDVLGLRLLYWGEDDEVVVVASRPGLAAQVLARGSGPPPRDVVGACWLAFSGYRVDDRSGYVGVRVAPPGARLRLGGDRPTWEPIEPLVVAPDDDLRSRTVRELAELVDEDVAAALRAALSRPAERHVIRLTGGKDSRMVLAVAVRAGLEKEFCYETVGPPDLDDVRIASSLATHLGLRHQVRFFELTNTVPFDARFREFVTMTGSMVNGWELATPKESADVAVSGLCGELLRTYRKLPPDRWTDAGVQAAFPRSEFGRLGLLRDGRGDELHAVIQQRLRDEPDPSAHPLDRLHTYFARARLRFTRLGAPEELGGAHDLLPLYSPTTLRAAMAMDSGDRQSEVLLAEVMSMASDLLVRHPFTDAGWSGAALERLGDLTPAEVRGSAGTDPSDAAPAAGPNRPAKSTSLVEVLNRGGGRGRVGLLTEVFSDPANAAWEVLDRTAGLAAIDRYRELTTRERHELFGAATAAIWMAG